MEQTTKKSIRSYLFPDENERKKSVFVWYWVINIAFLLLFSAICGIFSLRLATSGYSIELFQSFFGKGAFLKGLTLLVLNILPTVMLTLICFFAFNRTMPAVLTSGLLTLVLSCVNYFKLAFRDDPFLFGDIMYVTEAANVVGGYEVRLNALMYGFIAFIALSAVLAKLFFKARIKRRALRIASPFSMLVIFAILCLALFTNDALYAKTSNTNLQMPEGEQLNEWNDTDQYCSRGFLYPFIYSASEIKIAKPDGYDKDEAESLAQEAAAFIADDKKVNFVSIMLEAYSDLEQFDIDYEIDPYEFYRELCAESVSGELVTNIFAGGTIDTERTYITGSTELYEYRGAADSFARYFAENGYYTQYCHPGYGWFYNRQNVMEYLGFQSVHFFEDRYDMGTGWIMDDAPFFSDLITVFEDCTGTGTPYFGFSTSYQNHGPYDAAQLVDSENIFVSQGDLSDYSYNVLNNYLYGIKKTDDALRDFIAYFKASEEPTVIVLFGDHKPWLGDGNSVYHELGADFSLKDDESFYQYYNTPYIIWANDAAKQTLGNDFVGDGGSFSPCFLMMKVFELCSYEPNSTIAALRELYESLDVISATGRCRENGALGFELSDEAQAALQKYLSLQYYSAFQMY